MRRISLISALCLIIGTHWAIQAQTSDGLQFPLIGHVQPRSALEIEDSNWSVGAETMDRDYTVYKNWKKYLGPLGVKKARVQAGWAKCEPRPGVYNWAWLDEIVFDMVEQGVEPWLSLSYGNPIYAGGGTTLLMGAVPTSEEALVAWERWVHAIVARYKHVVDEWEIWNEPNYRIAVADYARLLIRSAEAVHFIQPEGKILAFALGSGVDYNYADRVLQIVAREGKIGLIDEVTFHRHQFDPENYEPVYKLQAVLDRYDQKITIRQGESGAPSEFGEKRALSNYPWTELAQAKWNLRRMLGDLGRGIPTSVFGIIDMKYPDEMNRKGLLYANEDKTVGYVKPAYYAVQHLTSIFDHNIVRIPNYGHEVSTDSSLSVFGYKNRYTGEQIVTLWHNNGTPGDRNDRFAIDLTLYAGQFSDPVYIDLRTGDVFEIPVEYWEHSGTTYRFQNIPVYDSPILISDRSNVMLKKEGL